MIVSEGSENREMYMAGKVCYLPVQRTLCTGIF